MVGKTKAQKKQEKDEAAKVDDPKAGADVGKIVNLISGDSNRVQNIVCFSRLLSSNFAFQISRTASSLYVIYGGIYNLVSPNSQNRIHLLLQRLLKY